LHHEIGETLKAMFATSSKRPVIKKQRQVWFRGKVRLPFCVILKISRSAIKKSEASDTQSRFLLWLYTLHWKYPYITMLLPDARCGRFDFLFRKLFLLFVSHALRVEFSSLQIPGSVFRELEEKKTPSCVIQQFRAQESIEVIPGKWNSSPLFFWSFWHGYVLRLVGK
jgi:hypothetical protein